MTLDTTILEKAIASLGRAVSRAQASPGDEELRDAVIQRFEYTMDLSWKMIQRAIRNAGVEESAIHTKRDLFREAARMGWIVDPTPWFEYYDARNKTSHTYNSEVAHAVFQRALEFFPESQVLCGALQRESQRAP